MSVTIKIPESPENLEIVFNVNEYPALVGVHGEADLNTKCLQAKWDGARSMIAREGIGFIKCTNFRVEADDFPKAFCLDFKTVDDLARFVRCFADPPDIKRGYICATQFEDRHSQNHVYAWMGAVKSFLKQHGVDHHLHYRPVRRPAFEDRDGNVWGGGRVEVSLNSLEELALHLSCLESGRYMVRTSNYLIDRHAPKKPDESKVSALPQAELG